ncbi:hypothetical protein K2173_016548 [Erythroxylum novogranatense]|uniref:Uncharacterized protein n=1 Tax=Erythroxylum novogranatense TaxID=1862640 RepID=A0AAV8SH73_9ROSI|nr:hypothetical protein K2173_016548 [Erythroxylum novogranatense]
MLFRDELAKRKSVTTSELRQISNRRYGCSRGVDKCSWPSGEKAIVFFISG